MVDAAVSVGVATVAVVEPAVGDLVLIPLYDCCVAF